MNLSNREIRLAIEATTGPGDQTPNAHRVKSYLGYLRPPGDPLRVDYGESFDQISRYIWENYGIRTVLSDSSTMAGSMDLQGEYYIKPSSSYTTTFEESVVLLQHNNELLNGLTHSEKRGRRRAGHHNTER